MTADKQSLPTLPLNSILQASCTQEEPCWRPQVSNTTANAPSARGACISRKRLLEVIDAALRILDDDDDDVPMTTLFQDERPPLTDDSTNPQQQ